MSFFNAPERALFSAGFLLIVVPVLLLLLAALVAIAVSNGVSGAVVDLAIIALAVGAVRRSRRARRG